MLRMVIDANYADKPELGAWLARRADNIAVLPEVFYIEAYHRGSVDSVARAFEQLAQRPRQVLVLASTGALLDLPARRRGAARRTVNRAASRDFPSFVRDLQQARMGNPQ